MTPSPLPHPVGAVIRFRFPVTGGSYLARVESNGAAAYRARVIGFPNGPERLQVGEVVTVAPEWVEAVAEEAR